MKKKSMLIAGNWKMNLSFDDSAALLKNICDSLSPEVKKTASSLHNSNGDLRNGFSLLVAPSFLSTIQCRKTANELLPALTIASQDLHFDEQGAYTGRIAASMLANSGINCSLVGHSETRKYFHETNETIRKKINALHNYNMLAIVCVGETLTERENGQVETVLRNQIETSLAEVDFGKIVLAYEPVWAIGTGKTATPTQAEEAHVFIKKTLMKLNEDVLPPVLYGGSVNEKNAQEILAMPNIDGALVGGASLNPTSFAAIAEAGLKAFKLS